jgi:hypothetical protein
VAQKDRKDESSRERSRLLFLFYGIHSNDRENLGAALGHDVSHSSTHAPEMKPEQKQEQAVTPHREIAPEQEQSLDIGLGIESICRPLCSLHPNCVSTVPVPVWDI